MDVNDYDDILEWSWTDDIVEYDDGQKIEVLASISNQNSDMCMYYTLRDALKSRKNLFEISCEESDASYFSEFGEDVSVQQLMDAVPRSRGSLRKLSEYARHPGVTTDRCYNDLASQIPGERLKDVTGCPKIQIHDWVVYSGFGGFTKEKVMAIARELEEYGPALGYFVCPSNLMENLRSKFILKPGEKNLSKKGADGVVRSSTHAVLLTGFGRAVEKSSGVVNYFWKIQNNWGDNCPVARILLQSFAEIYMPKFKNAIEITASPELEVLAEYKAVREQVFRDYTLR